ncbi:flagellar filament capping protein FliD [Roseateles violae]|uniref:Flagellar hook-associated protein 2 n=1 Tax=Roseateles violae TaxID=3058042 RepID=A0ABT8DXL8_9BURK|nr:flagellar filament capping protein FliD [Pelomonas sp. PFR6]MDN3921569.1 flagellar filament capping protein FliD [Pelomonas sp. PFR6]
MAEINPASMAQQLATVYTQQTQSLLDSQSKSSQATASGLAKLSSSLRAFNTAVAGLSGKKSLNELAGAFADASFGTASVVASALPGTYQIYVEKLASSHQVAFNDLPAVPAWPSGPVNMTLRLDNGANFVVDLSNADGDGDGTLSQVELARAINQAGGNGGNVTAQVISGGGKTQLLLSSGVSGKGGKISVDLGDPAAGGVPNGALRTALDASQQTELVAAENAVVWMGAQGSGMRIEQANNTLTAIDGVSIALTKVSAPGAAPTNFTVSKDESGTTGNVKSFIDAYNTLEKALDDLTANASGGIAAGALASDSGVRALRSRLSNLLRQDFGGLNLRGLGITIDRSGSLSLDSAKLSSALAKNPAALDTVFGSASLTAPSGLFGDLGKTVDQWTNGGTGFIKQRQDSVQSMQKAIGVRQTRLDTQYTQAYNRYLRQFSALQELQSRLGDTSGLLASLAVPTASTS